MAARKFGASEIVDPRPWTVGTIKETFARYPLIGPILPAMGYGAEQMKDLQSTINKTDCDVVVVATPVDLNKLLRLEKPSIRVRYELQEIGKPTLEDVLSRFK